MAFVLGSAGLVLGAAPLLADDASDGGLYLSTDAGVNLANLSVGSASVSLDTGYRIDLAAGYGIKLSDQFTLAPELEVGFLGNSIVGFDFYQVPVLGKGILSYKINDAFSVYAGGGAGYESLITSWYGLLGDTENVAWQVEGGLKYKFGRSELGLGYKYLDFKPAGFELSNNSILLSYTLHF